jgi:L-seryl-tRNA(Ser) seleniumtransferase
MDQQELLTKEEIFCSLGCRPVINACGVYTDLGGSRLSPQVWRAMTQANEFFVSVPELLDKTGQIVADSMEAEAARITMGASAAITLATAASIAGTDGQKMDRLPNTEGMKDRVLIQKRHRYKYDRMVRLAGARLVEVGDEDGTEPNQLSLAITDNVAAIIFPAHLDEMEGTVPLPTVAEIAHAAGIPVIVDAAYMNYPTSLMSSFGKRGADVVIFSAKYFSGPNAGGFMYGQSRLIEAVGVADFVRHESGPFLKFGRTFKQDRQTIVGTLMALREWLEMDHQERFAQYGRRVETIASYLEEMPGVQTEPMQLTMQENLEPEPVNCLDVRIDPQVRPSAAAVSKGLFDGNPSIAVHLREDAVIVDVECVSEAESHFIGQKLRDQLERDSR